MSKMIDTYTDQEIMRALLTSDFSGVGREFVDDEVKSVKACQVFYNAKNLDRISLPNLVEIGGHEPFYNFTGELDIPYEKLVTVTAARTFAGVIKNEEPIDLNFASLTTIQGEELFKNCTGIRSVSFPLLKKIESCSYLFSGCANLESIKAPLVERWSGMSSMYDSKVTVLDLPKLMYYDGQLFQNIKTLQVLRVGGAVPSTQFASYGFGINTSSIPSLQTIIFDHLSDVPNMTQSYFNLYVKQSFENGANVYFPGDIADILKTSDYWSDYADQIFAIEDHPEVIPTEV